MLSYFSLVLDDFFKSSDLPSKPGKKTTLSYVEAMTIEMVRKFFGTNKDRGIIRDYVLTESNVNERAVAQNFIELLERVNTYFIYYYCKVDESYENFVYFIIASIDFSKSF